MKIIASEWNAWYNIIPGSDPKKLHVTGKIDVKSESTDLFLLFHSYDKSNPPRLLLQLNERTIFIPRNEGDTIVRVHYEQAGEPGDICGITVLDPNGGVFAKIESTDIDIVQ